ncbi:MAG TPA: zinc ribbon domain-containing protein [Thermoanaerobaculia bacterium]|jgi:hypothetical protein|nr:zinc ribbon domain-containing protein [Thermoanaerobaculia bacterium]
MKEQRYCTNCREPLPAGATWCEKCGTDVGEVFDGRVRKPRASRSATPWIVALLILGGAAAAWFYRSKIPFLHQAPVFDSGPIRVVRQRPGGVRRAPGAKLSEPEAMQTLRRHLAPQVKSECLAVASRGYKDDAYGFDVVDSCKGTKMGRWQVNGKTGEVTQYLRSSRG